MTAPGVTAPVVGAPTGLDPGSRDGAVAVVVGDSVVAWWAWQSQKRGFALYSHTGDSQAPTLHSAATAIAESARPWAPLALVAEGLFGACAVLAAAKGEVVGPLRAVCVGGGPVAEPRADDWRARVLGLPPGRIDAKRAGAAAMQWAYSALRWPGGWPGRLPGPCLEAVCEAAAMTKWIQRDA